MSEKPDGYYYLHENGDLIYKKYLDEEQESDFYSSPFVKKFWPFKISERESAWIIAIEAAGLGANKERVKEVVEKWKLTNDDAHVFAERTGLNLTLDGDKWMASFSDFINIQESQCGFGNTCFDAFVELFKGGNK